MPDLGRSWTRNATRENELDATFPVGLVSCEHAANLPSLLSCRARDDSNRVRLARSAIDVKEQRIFAWPLAFYVSAPRKDLEVHRMVFLGKFRRSRAEAQQNTARLSGCPRSERSVSGSSNDGESRHRTCLVLM